MTPQPGKQALAIHILPNMSRSKGNQAMETGQLIEHNENIFFLEKTYIQCGGQTFARSFFPLNISLDQQSKLSILLCVTFRAKKI